MPKENEQQTTETPAEETPPSKETPPESSDEVGPQFEEPDFGAITDFVEGAGEDETGAPEAKIADEVAVADVTPTEPVAEEVKSESEVSEEVVEDKPEAVVAEEPAKEEPTKEEPAVTPEPEPEPVKVPTKEDLQGMYAEHREKSLPQLEALFTLSEEEAAALDEQPSKVIPKLAGQMMYDTMLSTYNAVMTALPSVIGTYMAATRQADSAEVRFMERWPDLNKPTSAPVVSAAIRAYRSANPRAVLDDIIKGAGIMAMINLGLDPMAKKELPKETKPAAPAKPAAPRGAPPTPPVKPGSEEENVFSEMTRLIQEEQS